MLIHVPVDGSGAIGVKGGLGSKQRQGAGCPVDVTQTTVAKAKGYLAWGV